MTYIDDVLAERCPAGVPFRALGEVGEFVRGSGLQRKDFVEAGFPCIHYGQIYTYYGTSTRTTKSFVSHELAASLKQARPGDVVITTTSENVEDVCSALAWLGQGNAAIGGHSCVYRHSLDPLFVSYYFQTEQFERQKRRYVTGTKVKDIKVSDLARVRIPVPPLEVQREIVRILEAFTALEAELEAELEARSRQYAYYRYDLLNFAPGDVRWVPLSELGSLYSGLTGKGKADFVGGNARYVSYKNVFGSPALDVTPEDRVRMADGEMQNRVRMGDVIFTGSSESVAEVGMSSSVLTEPPEPLYLNSFCFGFRPEPGTHHPRFSKHLFRARVMRDQIVKTGSGVTRINVSKERFRRILVPIPSMEEQVKIADSLDRFEALVSDLSFGLPAELLGRRRQFEFYRDRLLSFEELPA